MMMNASADGGSEIRRSIDPTHEIIEQLLTRIEGGESLAAICRDARFPSPRAIYRKLASDEEFQRRWDFSLMIRSERWAEELIVLSDSIPEGASAEYIAAVKLRVDTRKWIIARLLPKKYGDNNKATDIHLNQQVNNFTVITEQERLGMIARRKRLQRFDDCSDNVK